MNHNDAVSGWEKTWYWKRKRISRGKYWSKIFWKEAEKLSFAETCKYDFALYHFSYIICIGMSWLFGILRWYASVMTYMRQPWGHYVKWPSKSLFFSFFEFLLQCWTWQDQHKKMCLFGIAINVNYQLSRRIEQSKKHVIHNTPSVPCYLHRSISARHKLLTLFIVLVRINVFN